MLMLLPPIQGFLFKKRDYKKDLVTALGLKYGKIVFILLNDIIVIYMRLTLIVIRGPRFKSPLWRVF